QAPPFLSEEGIRVVVLRDGSDTWGHNIAGFTEPEAGAFEIERAVLEESGPIRVALRIDARFDRSRLSMWARLYRHDALIEVDLRIHWAERLQLAKMVVPLSASISERRDGIPGGGLVRSQHLREFPVVDWTAVRMQDKGEVGIAAPDCWSLDSSDTALRFTLVRSPVHAWHDPYKLSENAFYRYTDQGEHHFRFSMLPEADGEKLKRLAVQAHRPPVCHDWTRGMG
ncbi:glycoside hydrolase family 38 C-terminal domain-containing protein, partial [Verrucomicrobiota bacterium]